MQALFRGVRSAISGAAPDDDHDGSASDRSESSSDSGGETVLMERELRVVDGQLVLEEVGYQNDEEDRDAVIFHDADAALEQEQRDILQLRAEKEELEQLVLTLNHSLKVSAARPGE